MKKILLAFALLATCLLGQVVPYEGVQKVKSTNRITEDLVFGTGRTFQMEAGSIFDVPDNHIPWLDINKAGSGILIAGTAGDVFTLVAGDNVTLTADTVADTLTIASTGGGGGGSVSDWGDIGGTLSDQTDLQAALDAKQPLATVLTNTTASFTTADETKLDGIATGATANSSDATLLARANHTGTQAISTVSGLQTALDAKQPLAAVLTATTASFTTADETKLDGIASGATANSSDATLLARANHTGTQAISTVSGLQTALDDKQPLAAVLTNTTASFTTADETKLDGVEIGATADQSDAEIETAYNNQVAAVSQAEAEAGTETAVRRWSPLRVAQAVAALGGSAPVEDVELPFESDALAWWDNRTADFAVTGSLVDSWTDRVNGIVLTASGATRPTLNDIDGENHVYFNNAHYLTIPSGFSWDRRNSSLFVVTRRPIGDTNNRALVSVGAGTTDETFFSDRELRLFNSGNQATGLYIGTNAATVYRVANGATSTLMGVASESSSELANDTGTVSGGYVGLWGDGTSFPYIGDILAIVAYDRTLSAPEIEDVMEFLTDEYNSVPHNTDEIIVFDGDSLTAGTQSSDLKYWAYPEQLSRLYSTGPPKIVNIGIGGQQIQNVTAAAEAKTQLSHNIASTDKKLVFWMGSNDLNNARTGAQVWTDIETYVATVKATYPTAVIIGLTVLERGDNSGSEETERAALNALILGTSAADGGFDYTVDLTADARLADPTNTLYFDVDGIHLNDDGYAVVAELVKAQLDALVTAAEFASQAEAEAGTENTKTMTPLRTAQAIRSITIDRSRVAFEEDWIGATSAGSGHRSWTSRAILSGATSTYNAGDADHPAAAEIRTGTGSSGNGYSIQLTPGNADNWFDTSKVFDNTWIFRFTTSIAATKARIGFANSGSGEPTDGVWVRYDVGTDTNLTFVCRNSSTETTVDTGVPPVLNTWYRVRIRHTGDSAIKFTLDSGTEESIATNIPTTLLRPSFILTNSTTTEVRINIDYMSLVIEGLSR